MMAVIPIIRKWFWDLIRLIGIYNWYVVADCLVKVIGYYLIQRRKSAGYPVVVIDHNFIQDIEALKAVSATEKINLICIPYDSFYLLGCSCFNEDIRDGSYLVDEMTEPKKHYRKILQKLFTFWRPQKFIKAFVAPSDSFFWIREIVALLQERSIPCIVVDKEGTISPHSMEFFSMQIAKLYPFISDWILVWSERQKSFWQRTGVTAEQIRVVGQPRSDFYFNTSVWLPGSSLPGGDKPLILFFTFETDAYAPTPGDHIWRGLRQDIHSCLVEFAVAYPDVHFVVKTHPQQIDKYEVEQEFANHVASNISVLHGPELARQLIVNADVIIGFQTTALIEAMLARKRVIYTEWSEEVSTRQHHLIPFHKAQGIDIVNSRQEFAALLASIIETDNFIVSEECQEMRKEFTDIFIPNADGKASTRVLQNLRNFIEQNNDHTFYRG